MKIIPSVIGLGYVGLPLFIRLQKKFRTIGFDTDISRVLYSHSHGDQTHGINDLRIFYLKNKKKNPCFC